MFCENCGSEIPDNATFCSNCGKKINQNVTVSNGVEKEKNMILALIISFFLTGLGIAYAGNVKKGLVIFVVGSIFLILGSILSIIGILIWAYGLYETYNQVKIVNGESNPDLINDWKSWEKPKKVKSGIVILIVLVIVIGTIAGALTPKNTTEEIDTDNGLDDEGISSVDSDASSSSSSSDSSSPSSSSSSSSGDYYSSSSNGHDVSSHYEGEYGSSDTHGTVYDDGSVEAHETGHTDYGDYKIDSYMDSDGNVHGTVDVGGKTYYVNN